MLPSQKTVLRRAGSAIAKLAGGELLMADLLNALLGCEADGRLSDAEVEAADYLFGVLCEYRPDAVELAHRQ